MILERFVAENKQLHIDGMRSLQCQLEDVQHELQKLQSKSKWGVAAPQAIYETASQSSPIEAPAMVAGAEDMKNLTSQTTASDQMVLRSLHFNAINNRETQIAKPHAETLKWLLDPSSPSSLAKWLESQTGVYWINGKAGSGKSTLMKYLVAHSQTAELLNTWAGTQTLVTASVYFWHAGTVLQKSQEGLFRSLLFEILRKSPDLIRVVCASKLAAFRPFDQEIEPWTELELREAIGLLKGETRMNARYCFFIDGLDEYDGHPDDIIDVLQSLCSLPDIKLCVSSRPWNEFIDAFGQDSDTRLALEDLTREDIRIYVKQTLEKSSHFVILKQKDTRSQELVEEIVDKARGVFLWVVLVTRSLLDGVRNADRICDLQRRLRKFPGTLEKYFSHMYFSIDETYREQTAQTFKYVLAASIGERSRPLPLILFSFLDEEDLDATVMGPCSNPLTEEEISSRQDIMRTRLIARCKGLVEIVDRQFRFTDKDSYDRKLLGPVVDFIHRTAYDFLATKDMQKQLSENLKPNFEADSQICKAYVVLLKSIDYSSVKAPGFYLGGLLRDLARYAGHLETKSGVTPITLLDEARSVVLKHENCFRDGFGSSGDYVFFRDFILYGSHYITEVLNRESHQLSHHSMSELIYYVVRTCFIPEALKIDFRLLDSLLEHGGSPSRAWKQILRNLHLHDLRRWYDSDEILVGILKKLIQYGADPQHRVVTEEATGRTISGTADSLENSSARPRSARAQEIITRVLGEEKAREIFSTKQIRH